MVPAPCRVANRNGIPHCFTEAVGTDPVAAREADELVFFVPAVNGANRRSFAFDPLPVLPLLQAETKGRVLLEADEKEAGDRRDRRDEHSDLCKNCQHDD